MVAQLKTRALRSLLQGISVLDLPKLEVHSKQEAEDFVRSYGVDLSVQGQWSYLQSIYNKAYYFLFEYLLERKPIEATVPRHLETQEDVYRLLMQASRDPELAEARLKSLWTCAILRVCHVLFHAEHDWRNRYLPLAKDQVIKPIAQLVEEDLNGQKWLGSPRTKGAVPLFEFTSRTDKPFESRLMKLILKPQYGNQDIYDRIALRFVTFRRVDTLRALQYLLDCNVFSMAHLLPKRSRNSLFDIESAFLLMDEWDGVDEDKLQDIEERLATVIPKTKDNKVSSDQYRACHITLRKMVTTLDESGVEYRFFLPFEIQLMDRVSFEDSVLGYSSHDSYKRSQYRQVVRRVVGGELYGSFSRKEDQKSLKNDL